MKALQPTWGALDQDGRLAALGQAINAELVGVGVPPFEDVVWRDFPNKGAFVQGLWEYRINIAVLNTVPLGDEDAAELTNVTLHEARHAEQAFLAARYKAGRRTMTDDQLAADAIIPKKIATVANQQQFDAQTDAATKDLGKQMYEAMVTDRTKNQQTSDAVLAAIQALDPRNRRQRSRGQICLPLRPRRPSRQQNARPTHSANKSPRSKSATPHISRSRLRA